MAKATKIPSDYKVTLELSKDEAETLLCLMNCIGGSSSNSPRKHTDQIALALDEIGVDYKILPRREESSLWLLDYPAGD